MKSLTDAQKRTLKQWLYQAGLSADCQVEKFVQKVSDKKIPEVTYCAVIENISDLILGTKTIHTFIWVKRLK
jgi:hypothetical protein